MRQARNEHQEQAALFRWAEFALARWPELALLHAIPNGGHRHKATAARLKAEGVRAGVPDICLPVARGGFHGLYLELKTDRGGASAAQRRWLGALRSQGYRAELCRGWHRARRVIEAYLALDAEAGRRALAVTHSDPHPHTQGAHHERAHPPRV